MVKKSTRKGVITRPRHEDRSDEGYGFECGVDYVLFMMGISNSNRALISKQMAAAIAHIYRMRRWQKKRNES